MGVPKFYRWTSERYPCLSEVINESQIPEFDNLYLDMNGIIHNCSHPNDDDVTFRITEDEIFTNIFAYIENLYNLIRPQKTFFMAVDGVAPRAKMNQQRARRFMSARTAEAQMKKAKEKGEILPEEKRFDSNCITPGTFFMVRLHEKLADWIERKSASDPRWHGRRIILSGHNCPGEGEHKIMDFIRAERASDGYDPNTRHCMYGLDADLIMLGIVSHEPHFSLLREEVNFNTRPRRNDSKAKKPQRTDCVEKTFHLLHLSLLREYLAWEFSGVKDALPFAYDMERIADDWILMGLLVGNDFLPHLPNIHIHDDALPLLYNTYKKVLPTLDGYINESGYLNLARFEKFLKQLSLNDKDSFMEKIEDEQFLDSKRIQNQPRNQNLQNAQNVSKKPKGSSMEEEEELVPFESSDIENDEEDSDEKDSDEKEEDAAFVSDDEGDGYEEEQEREEIEEESESSQDFFLEQDFNDELATLALSALDDKDFANNVEACWTRTLNNSFKRHKKAYYNEKLRYKNISKTELRAQAEGYVRAIQWNLHYYYHGCASWSWFYPHHYAPFISDVFGFSDMGTIEFELSEPFRPFEQLLAVLPEASSDCLPKPLQKLMTANPSESPIHDFYPMNFETDLNGKRNDWEAVVLIPFIDEKRLLEAIRGQENQLSKEEKARNSHGGHIMCISHRGSRPGEEGHWIVDRKTLPKELFCIPRSDVKWGLLPNVKMDVYFPGFPTMKHLSHSGGLRHANCNVFGMASRKESMVLTVEALPIDVIEMGSVLCDEEVCIDWPILKLAKVEEIWGDEKIVRKSKDEEIIVKDMKEEEKKQWIAHVNQLTEHMITRYAIEIGGLRDSRNKQIRPAIVWVRKFTGLVYETVPGKLGKPPMLKAVKQWTNPQSLVPVLLPLVVKDILLESSRLLADLPIKQAYPEQSVVWITDPKITLFGMPGMVSGYKNEREEQCRIKVVGMVQSNRIDDLEEVRKKYDEKSLRWMGGHDCARQIQMDTRLFARITGTILMWNEPRERVEKGQQLSSESKINCGLALKFSKREICLADYTDRTDFTNQRGVTQKTWFYSSLTCRLVQEYRKKFPEVIKFLEKATSQVMDDVYYSEDIWFDEKKRNERFAELKEFLDTLPSREAENFPCGTVYADRALISEIEKALQGDGGKRVMSTFWVQPANLFRYELYDGKVHVDSEQDFEILDRVALMSSHTRCPKTVQGTVVGIHGEKIDVLFDRNFEGGSKVRGSKLSSAYRVPRSALFNVTYGLVRKNGGEKKKQQQKQLEGAYVPLPQKNKKQDTNSGAWKDSGATTSSGATSSKWKDSGASTSSKSKKSGKKEKPEKVQIAKRPAVTSGESTESMTASLNAILNIKPPQVTSEVQKVPESLPIHKLLNMKPETSESIPATSSSSNSTSKPGKQVSLMELMGGGAGKKKMEGSKTLEEIEKEQQTKNQKSQEIQKAPGVPSILQKLSDAQKPKQKLPKEEKWGHKKVEVPKSSEPTSEAPKAPKPSSPPSEVPGLTPEAPAASEVPPMPFGMPPGFPGFHPVNFPPPPMFGGIVGPPMVPIGMPIHPTTILQNQQFQQQMQQHIQQQMNMQNQQIEKMHQQQQKIHAEQKRANPTLTDFKPSTVNNHRRAHGHRGNPHAPKVTMITKDQQNQKKAPTPLSTTPATAATSSEAVVVKPSESKKPRKKKQSRLAVQFQNAPDA